MIQEEVKASGIKLWAENDRPREKLINQGRLTLSEAELIAILIGSGSKKESAVELSRRILASVGNNLNQLGKLGVPELTNFEGIGPAKAVGIVAALELGRRRKETDEIKRIKITSSKDAYDYFYPDLSDLPHEEFWVLYLNRANKVISKNNISKGGIAGTVADSRLIFKAAIEQLASSIILCHNHPSGNNKPSDADIQLTNKIKESGKILDIQVLDHIIIAGEKYYSFADEGLI